MTTSTAPRLAPPAAATTLALWCCAWQAGARPDEVLGVLGEIGMRAGVRAGSADAAARSGLPGPGEPSGPLADLLPLMRRGGHPQLVVPIPGDVRGLPPGGDIVAAALDCGAAVVLPDAGIGLVPADGQWRAYACGTPHRALDLHEAAAQVADAIAHATTALARADLASARGNPRAALERTTREHQVIAPPGLDAAVAALLDRATLLAALLSVAATHDAGIATARQAEQLGSALAPLQSAVREARRTVVASAGCAA